MCAIMQGKEQASTKVALAVTNLQRLLPRARVLYCSATGVSDVKNMVSLLCGLCTTHMLQRFGN